MAGMLILCMFLLPAAMVVSPLSIAERLPASPPAAVSGLQRAFEERRLVFDLPLSGTNGPL